MHKGPRLAHVVLLTPQLHEMVEFYTTLLDGQVVYEGYGMAFITCDEEHHRVAFAELPVDAAPKPLGSVGMHHMAFSVEDLDALLDRYQRLVEKGIKPAIPIQHGITTSLYYRDPDGNFVEIQIDNFTTPEEATAYLKGPNYAEDAIGPSFDVDRMVAARKAGASVAELTTRAWALAGPPQPDPRTVFMPPESLSEPNVPSAAF